MHPLYLFCLWSLCILPLFLLHFLIIFYFCIIYMVTGVAVLRTFLFFLFVEVESQIYFLVCVHVALITIMDTTVYVNTCDI